MFMKLDILLMQMCYDEFNPPHPLSGLAAKNSPKEKLDEIFFPTKV